MTQIEQYKNYESTNDIYTTIGDVDVRTMIDELQSLWYDEKEKYKLEKYKKYGFFTDQQAEDYVSLQVKQEKKVKLKGYEIEYLEALKNQERESLNAILKWLKDQGDALKSAFRTDIKTNPSLYDSLKLEVSGNSENDVKDAMKKKYPWTDSIVDQTLIVKVWDNRYRLPLLDSNSYIHACDKSPKKEGEIDMRTNYEKEVAILGHTLTKPISTIVPKKPIK